MENQDLSKEVKVEEEQPVEEAKAEETKVEENKIEEVKEEVPADETPVEEVKAEETKPFDVLIEEKREPLFKEFKNSKKISNILTFAVLALTIAGMVLVSGPLAWLGWTLLGVGLVAMIVFYFFNKKYFEQHTREYLEFVNNVFNEQTFKDPKFSEIVVNEAKVEVADLENNGVYENIVRVASRNLINGKFDDVNFKYAEVAIFTRGQNKKQPQVTSFVGKYFQAENKLSINGNFVINISRETPIDAPNALEGRAVLFNADGVKVYGDEGADFRAALGEDFFGKIKKIPAERHLLNLAISISAGQTKVFMSYDDDVIAMPFDKPANAEAFGTFTQDLKKVFETVKILGK